MLNKLTSFLKEAGLVVIIGMGNELRADDAVGLHIVRLLKPYTHERFKVFEGHMTPEAFIAPACGVHPTHVLIIDAAELHRKPGSWQVVSSGQVEPGWFTTHAIPAGEVAAEINRRCGAIVAFLGIQPKSREVSLALSAECIRTAEEVVQVIKRILMTPSSQSE